MKISGLAYVVAASPEPAKWQRFGEQVVGLSAQPLGNGGLALKADERLGRIFVDRGLRDCYAASGWEVANQADFAAALAELDAAGAAAEQLSADQAGARGFTEIARFRDPAGNRHELGWGYRSDFRRFISPAGVPQF